MINIVGQPNVPLTFLAQPVLNRDQCNAVHIHTGRVHETMLCAGSFIVNNQGVCANTQGGGLYCNQNNNQRLFVGVLIDGFGCGANNRPGIYLQVNTHSLWCDERMSNLMYRFAGSSASRMDSPPIWTQWYSATRPNANATSGWCTNCYHTTTVCIQTHTHTLIEYVPIFSLFLHCYRGNGAGKELASVFLVVVGMFLAFFKA